MDNPMGFLRKKLDYSAISKAAVAMYMAGALFAACGKPEPGLEPDPGNGNGNGNGKKPPIEDTRTNRSVEDKIRSFVTQECPTHGHETPEQVMACVTKFVNTTLFIGKEDSIISKKRALVNANVGKIGNLHTFDRTSAFVEVKTGDCADREGSTTIVTPYNSQSRNFVYEYDTVCKEPEKD